MASQNSVRAGDAYVSLGLDDTSFTKAFSNAVKTASSSLSAIGAASGSMLSVTAAAASKTASIISGVFNGAIAVVGKSIRLTIGFVNDLTSAATKLSLASASFGTAASLSFLSLTKSAASANRELDLLSSRSGASVSWLSAMRYAAEQNGATLEDVASAIRSIRSSVMNGDESLLMAGIDPRALRFMSGPRQFDVVADAINRIDDAQRKATLGASIFGESLMSLVGLGSGPMRQLRDEAESLGLVLGESDVKAATMFQQSLARLSSTFSATRDALAVALAPTFADVANKISSVVIVFNDWLRDNPVIIQRINGVANAMAAFGAVAAGVISGAALLFSNVKEIIALLTTLGVAFGLAGDNIIAFGQIARQSFERVFRDVKTFFDQIERLVSQGRIEEAATLLFDVLVNLASVAFNKIKAESFDFAADVVDNFFKIWDNLKSSGVSAIQALKIAFNEVKESAKALISVMQPIAGAMNYVMFSRVDRLVDLDVARYDASFNDASAAAQMSRADYGLYTAQRDVNRGIYRRSRESFYAGLFGLSPGIGLSEDLFNSDGSIKSNAGEILNDQSAAQRLEQSRRDAFSSSLRARASESRGVASGAMSRVSELMNSDGTIEIVIPDIVDAASDMQRDRDRSINRMVRDTPGLAWGSGAGTFNSFGLGGLVGSTAQQQIDWLQRIFRANQETNEILINQQSGGMVMVGR